MNLENISKQIKEKSEIETSQEYLEMNFQLNQLKNKSNQILNYLTSPKRSDSNNILILTSNTEINSKYLKNLAETIETIDEQIWNYKQSNPQENFSKPILYSNELEENRYNLLLMYSAYLKSRKNPKNLNVDELKRIKNHPLKNNGFQLEIKEKTYNKINNNLDKFNYETIPKLIVFPFKMIYKGLKSIDTKINNFFDKYKYSESGTIPKEFFKY